MILKGAPRSRELAALAGIQGLVWGRAALLLALDHPLAEMPLKVGLVGVTLGMFLCAAWALRRKETRLLSDRLVYDVHHARRNLPFTDFELLEKPGQLLVRLRSGEELVVAEGPEVSRWAAELKRHLSATG